MFYPGDCDIVGDDMTILKSAPGEGWMRHIARIHPEPLVGPYASSLAHRCCPHCGYHLPFNIERVPNMSIVVVGDNFSGKSSYISALIHQLDAGRWMTWDQYTRVSCLNGYIAREYSQNYSRFFGYGVSEGSALSSPSIRDPLIYEFSFSSSLHQSPQSVNVILYDVPSSDLLSDEDREWRDRCLLRASAVIFLVAPEHLIAPEHLSNIASFLPPSLPSQGQREPSQLLLSLVKQFELQGHFKKKEALHFPTAVTISKSDLFQLTDSFKTDFLFSRDCTYNNETSWKDINAMERKIRRLLAMSGNTDLLEAIQELPQVKLFAVSARGNSPEYQKERLKAEPCRCLDPMLWILHELDIMAIWPKRGIFS